MNPIVDQDMNASQCAAPAARPAIGHRLGPLVYRVRVADPVRARLIAAVCFVGCAALLGTAAWLEPAGAGDGTHTQLGLPPCSMLTLTGLPCPTCGMTTAFAHTVRGQWLRAFFAQPAGFLLAVTTAVAGVGALVVLVRGSVWTVNWYRVAPTRVVFAAFALLLAGWALRIVFHLNATAPLAPYGQ